MKFTPKSMVRILTKKLTKKEFLALQEIIDGSPSDGPFYTLMVGEAAKLDPDSFVDPDSFINKKELQ